MKCVVDPVKRTFYLYSSEGDKKQVDCDTVDEFMNVLGFCPVVFFVFRTLFHVELLFLSMCFGF